MRAVSGGETRSTDRLLSPTEHRDQMLNFTAEPSSNPVDKCGSDQSVCKLPRLYIFHL